VPDWLHGPPLGREIGTAAMALQAIFSSAKVLESAMLARADDIPLRWQPPGLQVQVNDLRCAVCISGPKLLMGQLPPTVLPDNDDQLWSGVLRQLELPSASVMDLTVPFSGFPKELGIRSVALRDPLSIRVALLGGAELRLVVVIALIDNVRGVSDCCKVISAH
jgi:hypothetical protein